MEDLELKEQETVVEAPEKLDIAKLIADLKAQGLEAEQIKEALLKMKEEGKLVDEELAQAFKLLEEGCGECEKEDAEKLFGMKLF